jgi:medium-chain acyl-[acyl-carrier-protein] hydrolase
MRLFCFPHAGSGASIFRSWADVIPSEVQVCSIQLPGRECRMREKAYTRIEPMVRDLVDAMRKHIDIPFAFFGHSLGALIAFECARLLRKESLRPSRLFVSAYRAPQTPSSRRAIAHMPDSVFFEELRRLEGTPEEILKNRELMRLVAPALRADFEVAETYVFRPEPPLDVPISVFGGIGDRVTDKEKLEGWESQTSAGFKIRMFPGSHFFLQESRNALLRAVVEDLFDPSSKG